MTDNDRADKPTNGHDNGTAEGLNVRHRPVCFGYSKEDISLVYGKTGAAIEKYHRVFQKDHRPLLLAKVHVHLAERQPLVVVQNHKPDLEYSDMKTSYMANFL